MKISLERIGSKEASWLERRLGTETYRRCKRPGHQPGLAGRHGLVGLFSFCCAAAPVLAPPIRPDDPYTIPRDGYSPVPRPPGTEWSTRQPPLPFWWKTITGKDQWVHLMGTASGQWDIYYGVVWGTRTALRVGVLITWWSHGWHHRGHALRLLRRRGGYGLDAHHRDFIAFPFLPAAMTLSAILTPMLGRGLFAPMIALMFFGWTGFARLLRSDILSVQRARVRAGRQGGWRARWAHHDAPRLTERYLPHDGAGVHAHRQLCDHLRRAQLPGHRR